MRSAVMRPCASRSYSILSNSMPVELAVLDHEGLGRAVDDDLDAFLLGVLQLPRGGLEEAARLARHDLHALRAEPQAGAAAVHGGVADADDQHALADLVDVPEGHRLEPGDADVDVRRGFLPAGQLQLLALGRAGADEHRIEAAAASSSRMLSIGWLSFRSTPMSTIMRDLFVQHRVRQAERRDVGAHQPAGLAVLLEDGDLVAERHAGRSPR